MAVTPNAIVTPQAALSRTAVATTADVAFSAPVNVQTLVDDATNLNGVRLTSLYAITRATLAANLNCLIYKKVGAVYTLMDSALLATVTPSASVANGKVDFGLSEDSPMILEAGTGLAVAIGTTIANGVAFVARGGAY
jgi:hypothetical protein